MRLPHLTIAEAMALTVLAAVDCLVFREAYDDYRLALFFFGGLPLLNVLAVGLVLLAKRRRANAAPGFLAGFEITGGVILACYLALIAAFPDEGTDLLSRISVPLIPLAESVFPAGRAAAFSIVMAIVTVPELAIAAAGGFIHWRYLVAIKRRRD